MAAGIRRWWQSPDTRIVLPIHLSSRLGVILIGFLAVILIGFPPEAEKCLLIYDNDFLDLPARWHTGCISASPWKKSVQSNARRPSANIAFPAFPMSVRYLSTVLGRQPLWTGGHLDVAFYLALVYFLRLARASWATKNRP